MHPKREKASLWRFLLLHLCQCGITQLRTGTWICWSKWARSLPGSSITCLLETRRFRNSYPLPGSVKSCTGESVLTEIPSQFSPLISSMTPKANELWESSHSCDGCGACTRKGWPINGLCCRGKTGVPCRLLEVVLVSQWQNILESIQEIRGGDEYACNKHSVSGKRHCADAGVFLLVCCVIALETSGIKGADDFQLRQTAKAFGMVDIVGMSLYYSVGCYGKSGGCFVGFR